MNMNIKSIDNDITHNVTDNVTDNNDIKNNKLKLTSEQSLNSVLNKTIDDTNSSWSKLNKTNKLYKLNTFADEYALKNKLNDDETDLLRSFLIECVEKKRINKMKNVTYDKSSGKIIDIPALVFTKIHKRFTLKNTDKRSSTLKSLGPKKNQKNTKNQTT